eukprot:CAMPEP_0114108202 /NCGR_PEP_ID=MMETSP0043_2-20121206/95_1 /TAXON_ID=464988 /ORGANISM="Hemiselmis andersenii, Strain CCMP644" /LENGTH=131 /DNA_ID=CAMNT_0001199953 /DNA_START=135 /DNA_END=527 /DNA_ORIENTATION=-
MSLAGSSSVGLEALCPDPVSWSPILFFRPSFAADLARRCPSLTASACFILALTNFPTYADLTLAFVMSSSISVLASDPPTFTLCCAHAGERLAATMAANKTNEAMEAARILAPSGRLKTQGLCSHHVTVTV